MFGCCYIHKYIHNPIFLKILTKHIFVDLCYIYLKHEIFLCESNTFVNLIFVFVDLLYYSCD